MDRLCAPSILRGFQSGQRFFKILALPVGLLRNSEDAPALFLPPLLVIVGFHQQKFY
jgi:hypothetical protein